MSSFMFQVLNTTWQFLLVVTSFPRRIFIALRERTADDSGSVHKKRDVSAEPLTGVALKAENWVNPQRDPLKETFLPGVAEPHVKSPAMTLPPINENRLAIILRPSFSLDIYPSLLLARGAVSPMIKSLAMNSPIIETPPMKSLGMKITSKKSVINKAVDMKSSSMKTPAMTIPSMKSLASKTPDMKAPVSKTVALKSAASNTPALKSPAIQTPALNAPLSKTLALKSPASNTPAFKAPVSNTPAMKPSASKTLALKSPASNTPAFKTPVSKTPAMKSSASNTPAMKSPASKTLAMNSSVSKTLALNSSASKTLFMNSSARKTLAMNSSASKTLAMNSSASKTLAMNSSARKTLALKSPAIKSPPIKSLAMKNPSGLKTSAIKTPAVKSLVIKAPVAMSPTMKAQATKSSTVMSHAMKSPTGKTPLMESLPIKPPAKKYPSMKSSTMMTYIVKSPAIKPHDTQAPAKKATSMKSLAAKSPAMKLRAKILPQISSNSLAIIPRPLDMYPSLLLAREAVAASKKHPCVTVTLTHAPIERMVAPCGNEVGSMSILPSMAARLTLLPTSNERECTVSLTAQMMNKKQAKMTAAHGAERYTVMIGGAVVHMADLEGLVRVWPKKCVVGGSHLSLAAMLASSLSGANMKLTFVDRMLAPVDFLVGATNCATATTLTPVTSRVQLLPPSGEKMGVSGQGHSIACQVDQSQAVEVCATPGRQEASWQLVLGAERSIFQVSSPPPQSEISLVKEACPVLASFDGDEAWGEEDEEEEVAGGPWQPVERLCNKVKRALKHPSLKLLRPCWM